MAARNGVTDGVFIPGRRNCTYPVLEEDLFLVGESGSGGLRLEYAIWNNRKEERFFLKKFKRNSQELDTIYIAATS